MKTSTTAPLDAALAYLQAGLSVVPIKTDGTKAPAVGSWKKYETQLPTEAEVRRWFDRADPPGLAVVGGAVSGGLECIDFDVQAESTYPQWRELVQAEAPGLIERLCVIRTPRPGYHVRYRCTEITIPGNTKLAIDPALPTNARCIIETRGAGGYALVPGSPLDCHELHRPYEHFAGPDLVNVETITAVEREILIRCARSFSREAQPDSGPTATKTATNGTDLRPGEDYNQRGPDWESILTPHGWTIAQKTSDGKYYWRRPGKDSGWSATTGVCTSKANGFELFNCFSENASPFEGASSGKSSTCYSKFSAYALLNHNGDFKAAAKALAADGYGKQHGKTTTGGKAESNGQAASPQTNGNGHEPPRSPSSNAAVGPPSDRVQVLITTDEKIVNNAVVGALKNSPHLFQRGYQLVDVRRPAPKKERIERPGGSPVIVPLPPARLREELTDVVAFVRAKDLGKEGVIHMPAHPPDWCPSAVHARGIWPGVRPLEAVIEAPALRPDGTVLNRPGFDPATGLLYEPTLSFPPIPEKPGLSHAIESTGRLLELVSDFPFVGDAVEIHRAAWFAALLTPFARFAVAGPCPLFLMEAGTPGTGKSLLCDLIAELATGRPMARTSFPTKDEELRKIITSIAIAGDRLVMFDNVAGAFGGPALDAALTGTTWKDRVLGRSEMTADLPLLTIWYATGNNVALRGDARRRALPCRIEALDERPEERGDFKIPRLLEHVAANRGRLVTDCLTVLRAFEVAGRPTAELPSLGSFEGWSDLVRSAVRWVTGVDPCETRESLKAADSTVTDLAALLQGWAELPCGASGMTTRDAIREVRENPASYETLREVFRGWAHGDALPNAKTVGRRLMAFRGRIAGGKVLKATTDRKDVLVWSVLTLDTSPPG